MFGLQSRGAMATIVAAALLSSVSSPFAQGTTDGFAPGARTIVNLDFAAEPTGDVRQRVGAYSGKLDIVDKGGVRMLRASSPSDFVLNLPETLPKNFTLEFDLIPKACCNPVDLMVEGVTSGSRSSISAQIEWDADHFAVVGGNPQMFQMDMPAEVAAALPSSRTKVALSFEDETIRMYTNGVRVYTLTNRKFYRGQVLHISLGGQDEDKYAVYLARVRVADLSATIVASNVPQAGPRTATPVSAAPVNAVPATTTGTTMPLRVAPNPILPFLSLINGPGNSALEWEHNKLEGICWDGQDGYWGGCNTFGSSPPLDNLMYALYDWGKASKFQKRISFADVLSETITFADVADLGFGRRVWCGERAGGTLCFANSHGPVPNGAGTNNAQQNADAAASNVASRSYTVISKQATRFGGRFFFYQLAYPNAVDPTTPGVYPDSVFLMEQAFQSRVSANGAAIPSTLDSQGSKFAPHVCLSCHGGRFNPADNSVIDGSLLPIDPSRVAFSTLPGASRADQERKILAINQVIYSSGTALVQEYIKKMYGGDWTLPTLPARDDIVPAGWASQKALWNGVVRPYCIMCHMAQLGPLAFASFNDMMSVKDRVQKSVCTDGTMPHSEIAYRQFWTPKQGSLPADVLSTALGFKSCP